MLLRASVGGIPAGAEEREREREREMHCPICSRCLSAYVIASSIGLQDDRVLMRRGRASGLPVCPK